MTMRVALAVVLGALIALDLALGADGHHVPGIAAIVGLLGAGALVVVAKLIAKLGLQIRETRDE